MAKEEKVITKWWTEKGCLDLSSYQKKGGFSLLKKILRGEFSPVDIIEEIESSGLQGRGGAGFPTGKKWRLAREFSQKTKNFSLPAQSKAYFICNADESEPGTYKDKLVLERSPYLFLEGMIIGAFSISANLGYIYINGGYRETAYQIEKIIQELEKENWLGKNIQGSGFDFKVEVFRGAGSYVCGEETALLNSIEGKRGEPRIKPPFPIEKGLFGVPTVVNNVETLANITFILERGASFYKTLSKSPLSLGNKLFVLDGAINNPGVYEAPLGITLRELIENHAKGIAQGKQLKAVQVGGAAGRIYSPESLDLPLGYAPNTEIPVGSGSVLVIDQEFDLKRLLHSWSAFFKRESCGKCVPCREGTYQLYLLSERAQKGKLTAEDIAKIEDLLFTMQKASFCPLGSFATNCWESALELFPEEIMK